MKNLHPWQNKIVEMSKIWDTRTVHCIIDHVGNSGKSTLGTFMLCNKLAQIIYTTNDYKDILRMVCDMPTSNCYIIDMPRAIKKDKLCNFYSAIETIKNGQAYDDRYKFKQKIFDCPNIFVFTNKYPDMAFLSTDRWKFWSIDENLDLIPLDIGK